MIKRIDSAPDEANPVTTVIVKPNLSMSWRANMVFAGSIAFICMGIAIVYAMFGFWMILPFAGAEVVFVTVCLHLTVKRLSVLEVITVDESSIRLQRGLKKPEETFNLPRHWSRLDYHCPDSPFEVGSLCVQAHGKRYVLGRGLGRDEKRTLYTELKSLIKPVT